MLQSGTLLFFFDFFWSNVRCWVCSGKIILSCHCLYVIVTPELEDDERYWNAEVDEQTDYDVTHVANCIMNAIPMYVSKSATCP